MGMKSKINIISIESSPRSLKQFKAEVNRVIANFEKGMLLKPINPKTLRAELKKFVNALRDGLINTPYGIGRVIDYSRQQPIIALPQGNYKLIAHTALYKVYHDRCGSLCCYDKAYVDLLEQDIVAVFTDHFKNRSKDIRNILDRNLRDYEKIHVDAFSEDLSLDGLIHELRLGENECMLWP